MSSDKDSKGKSKVKSPPLERLCIHTATNRPLPLEVAIEEYVRADVHGITVWRDALSGCNIKRTGQMIRKAGLDIVSLCRGGFFVSPTVEGRAEAIEENKLIIREAVELGAPLLVLVCGANPAVPLDEARKQIRNGIEKVLPLAEELNIKLAIEPLHPMYAETRSAITYLFTANQICKAIDSPFLGVAVDVYHLWFDPKLENEIKNAGKKIFAFHVSDWSTPRLDVLNDRRIMGEGCIEIPRVRSWVEEAGFKGFIEVEIFSKEYWATDQRVYIKKIVEAYRAYV